MVDLSVADIKLREKTQLAIFDSRDRWRDRTDRPKRTPGWGITFLGTGGNPEAVIAQKPRTAGFMVEFGDLYMCVDPGPSALLGVKEMGLDLGALDAVYISHGHVDHYAGAEGIIEGMCWAMSTRRGVLMGPRALFTEDHIISSFHQGDTEIHGYRGGPQVMYLGEGRTVSLKGATITPVTAYHGGENYGFILEAQGLRLGYTSDTNYIVSYSTGAGLEEVKRFGPIMDLEHIVKYREDVKKAFSGVDVLIANVTSHNAWAHRHITGIGLAHLLKGSHIKLCYLTHFNYCCVEPEDLRFEMAEYVEKASGIRTKAAVDLAYLDLKPFLKTV